MHTSYLQLEQEAARLLKEAESLRKQERLAAIKQINEIAAKYNVKAEELSLTPRPRSRATPPESAKYRGPNGELWGGGRGRKPDWVRATLDSGESLEQFEIHAH